MSEYDILKKERDEMYAALKQINDLFFIAEFSENPQMYIKRAEHIVKCALKGKK